MWEVGELMVRFSNIEWVLRCKYNSIIDKNIRTKIISSGYKNYGEIRFHNLKIKISIDDQLISNTSTLDYVIGNTNIFDDILIDINTNSFNWNVIWGIIEPHFIELYKLKYNSYFPIETLIYGGNIEYKLHNIENSYIFSDEYSDKICDYIKLIKYRNNAIDFERNKLTDKIINGCSYYLKYITYMYNYIRCSDNKILSYGEFKNFDRNDIISILDLIKNEINLSYNKLSDIDKKYFSELLILGNQNIKTDGINKVINDLINYKIAKFEKEFYLDYKTDKDLCNTKYYFLSKENIDRIIDDHSNTLREYPLTLDF